MGKQGEAPPVAAAGGGAIGDDNSGENYLFYAF